jgi:hypothetical protein
LPPNIGGTQMSLCPVFAFPNARICWFVGERRDPGLLDHSTSARNAAGAFSKALGLRNWRRQFLV